MSKLVKFFAIIAVLAGTIAVTPVTALAQHHGGGHWHGGGGRGGRGPGFGFGWGNPYYYGGPYYYGPQANCGWARVRLWRNGHWVLRRSWRCW